MTNKPSTEGMVGLSMCEVAQMADVSASAIYRHFDSQEALLAAVAEEGFALYAEYLSCAWSDAVITFRSRSRLGSIP